MNDNHRPADIEARLDAAIDALNAGQPVSGNGDPELTSLIATVRSARNSAESEWPGADFPTRMAANLSTQLRATPQIPSRAENGHLDQQVIPEENPPVPSLRPANLPALPDEERPPSRRRQVAGIFATAAAFSVLTLILVFVFQSWQESNEPGVIANRTIEPRQIAFVKDIPGEGLTGQAEIFLVDVDGNNLTNLTKNRADDRSPAWSPDGETLAFVSNRTGRDQIYLMDADSANVPQLTDADHGNVRQLTDDDFPSEGPTWSPDGTSIAFIRQVDGIAVPWIMAADGSGQRPLENASDGDPIKHRLTWSPDGEMLAYTYQSESLGLGISSVDGENSRLITLLGEEIDGVDWSADGQRFAFAPFTETDNVGLIDARNILQGSAIEPRPLTTGVDMFASQPRWAPNGSRLLFFGSAGVPPQSAELGLYVTAVDANFMEKIHAPDDNQWLVRAAWSPTGHQIALLQLGETRRSPGVSGDTFNLVVMNADGTDLRVLADDIWSTWDDPPTWRPKPSDATTPPPTEVPQPAQTAVPIPGTTEASPSPSPQSPAETMAILTPTPPATDDFAAQVQAALDALPDEMVGCAATPGSFITLDESNTVDPTEYRGVALVGKEPLNALLFGVENDTLPQNVGPSGEATIFWNLGPLATEDLEFDAKELRRGTEIDPVLGTVLGDSGWINPAHLTSVTFPHAGCWQFIATYGGELAGVVWIEVAESQMDEPAETDQPALTVAPAIGTCETVPVIRGTGFEPGTQVTIHIGLARGDNAVPLGEYPTVAEDGTFEVEADLSNAVAAMCQSGQIPLVGANYLISAMTGTGPKSDGDNWREPSASTTYVVIGE